VNDLPPVLIGAPRIRRRVDALAREIANAYRGEPLVLVGVLKGAFVFLADLMRRLPPPVRVDFLRARSYGDRTETSGTVRLEFDLTQPVHGEHVLLVEDIIDTGLTAQAVLRMLKAKRPKSVRVCALLYKPARARVRVPIDFLGFTIPDRFVVGYGLDYMGLYRNLPYIGYIRPER
jgi:hypoxanthine phosphoribosyltransferase